MDAVILDRIQKLQNYQDRDSRGIEEEVTKSLASHLSKTMMGSHVIVPNGNYFRKVYDAKDNHILTDLDGVIVISDDPKDLMWSSNENLSNENIPINVLTSEKKTRIISKNVTKEVYMKTVPKQLIILEAKHYIDKDKVDYKFRQLKILREFLLVQAKDHNNPAYSTRFRNTVNIFNLSGFDDVLLYLGGPHWEEGIQDYIRQLCKTDKDFEGKVGLIQLSGDRYVVSTPEVMRFGDLRGGKIKKKKDGGSALIKGVPGTK